MFLKTFSSKKVYLLLFIIQYLFILFLSFLCKASSHAIFYLFDYLFTYLFFNLFICFGAINIYLPNCNLFGTEYI